MQGSIQGRRFQNPTPTSLGYKGTWMTQSFWLGFFITFMMTSSNGNIFRVTGHLCGEFTGPRWIPRTKAQSFDVFFDLRLNKQLSKKSWDWWFETLLRPLWRHCNVNNTIRLESKHVTTCIKISPITVIGSFETMTKHHEISREFQILLLMETRDKSPWVSLSRQVSSIHGIDYVE